MRQSQFSSPHAASETETKNSKNAEIGTNIAHCVRMMIELFLKLCIDLVLNCGKIFSPKPADSKKMPISFPFAQWHHVYAPRVYTWHHHASGFSTCYLRQCRALRTL